MRREAAALRSVHARRAHLRGGPRIEDVFDFLSDFENTEQWDPGTIETRRVSGDGGLGTTYRNRSQFMKREVELEYETIGYERPTSFVCRGRNGRTTATTT